MGNLRLRISESFRQRIESKIDFSSDVEISRSAMVFAPHQGDETLGCGGTIIRKRALRVNVDVVYMTDGRGSHSHLMSTKLLTALRAEEARAACEKLGVESNRVSFLNCPDGYVRGVGHMYVPKILDLIRAREPQEIYIPYARDPQADHMATNQLVRAVLKESRINATIMEYPIWAWYQWPWVGLPSFMPKQAAREVLYNTAKQAGGLRIGRDLNYGVKIDTVSGQKLLALRQHRTQMTRFNSDPRWLTLYDIANGDWVKQLLQGSEMFRSYVV